MVDVAANYTLAVNATVTSDRSATCDLPAWQSPIGNSSAVGGVNVSWPGGCTIEQPYGMYSTPGLVGVSPHTLPRFGGSALELDLDSSLAALPHSTVRMHGRNASCLVGTSGVYQWIGDSIAVLSYFFFDRIAQHSYHNGNP